MLKNLIPTRSRFLFALLACFSFFFVIFFRQQDTAGAAARPDAAGDRKRALLRPVNRLAVLPPFFGSDTLLPPLTAASDTLKPRQDKKSTPAMEANLRSYRNTLTKLEEHVRTLLPRRVQARTPFTLISQDDLTAGLKEQNGSPWQLFQNSGRIRGGKFPLPDLAKVRSLAARLHADALLLTVLDEPRRASDRYYFDPLAGVGYDSAHVYGKAAFYIILADGTEVLHDYVEIVHPLTRIGSHDYLAVDWQETEDQCIEGFLDEWTRYTPNKG